MNFVLKQLQSKEDFTAAYPLVCLLRPQLTQEQYWEYLGEMLFANYFVVGAYTQDKLIGLAIFVRMTDWLSGKHIWLKGLSVAEAHRSAGCGSALMAFVEEWARAQGCQMIRLTSNVARHGAHRFYTDKLKFEQSHLGFRKYL